MENILNFRVFLHPSSFSFFPLRCSWLYGAGLATSFSMSDPYLQLIRARNNGRPGTFTSIATTIAAQFTELPPSAASSVTDLPGSLHAEEGAGANLAGCLPARLSSGKIILGELGGSEITGCEPRTTGDGKDLSEDATVSGALRRLPALTDPKNSRSGNFTSSGLFLRSNRPGTASLSGLPTELKQHIVAYLPHISKFYLKHVNQEFHNILWETTLFPYQLEPYRPGVSSLPIDQLITSPEVLTAIMTLEIAADSFCTAKDSLHSCAGCLRLLPAQEYSDRGIVSANVPPVFVARNCVECEFRPLPPRVQYRGDLRLRWIMEYGDGDLTMKCVECEALSQLHNGHNFSCMVCRANICMLKLKYNVEDDEDRAFLSLSLKGRSGHRKRFSSHTPGFTPRESIFQGFSQRGSAEQRWSHQRVPSYHDSVEQRLDHQRLSDQRSSQQSVLSKNTEGGTKSNVSEDQSSNPTSKRPYIGLRRPHLRYPEQRYLLGSNHRSRSYSSSQLFDSQDCIPEVADSPRSSLRGGGSDGIGDAANAEPLPRLLTMGGADGEHWTPAPMEQAQSVAQLKKQKSLWWKIKNGMKKIIRKIDGTKDKA